jgi:hypothetical protein
MGVYSELRGFIQTYRTCGIRIGARLDGFMARDGGTGTANEPEGAASRGRPLPFERMPGVSAATRSPECTALDQRELCPRRGVSRRILDREHVRDTHRGELGMQLQYALRSPPRDALSAPAAGARQEPASLHLGPGGFGC